MFTMLRTNSEKGNREINLRDSFWGELRDRLYCLTLTRWKEVADIYATNQASPGHRNRDWQLWRPLFALAKWVGDPLPALILSVAKRNAGERVAKDATEGMDVLLLKVLAERVCEEGWYSDAELKMGMMEKMDEQPKWLDNRYVRQLLERLQWKQRKRSGKNVVFFITPEQVKDRCERYGVEVSEEAED